MFHPPPFSEAWERRGNLLETSLAGVFCNRCNTRRREQKRPAVRLPTEVESPTLVSRLFTNKLKILNRPQKKRGKEKKNAVTALISGSWAWRKKRKKNNLSPYFVVKKIRSVCSTEISTATDTTPWPNKVPLDRDGSENIWQLHSPLCSRPAWLTYYGWKREEQVWIKINPALTTERPLNPLSLFLSFHSFLKATKFPWKTQSIPILFGFDSSLPFLCQKIYIMSHKRCALLSC